MSHSHRFTTYALQKRIQDSLEAKRLLEGSKKTLELRLEVERQLDELHREFRAKMQSVKSGAFTPTHLAKKRKFEK